MKIFFLLYILIFHESLKPSKTRLLRESPHA